MPQELPLEPLSSGARVRVAVYGPPGAGKTTWRRRFISGEMRGAAAPPASCRIRAHLTGHVRGRDRPVVLHLDWTEIQALTPLEAEQQCVGYDAAICVLPQGCANSAAWLGAARAIAASRVVACVAMRVGGGEAPVLAMGDHPTCTVDTRLNLRIDAPVKLLVRALLGDAHAALLEPEPITAPEPIMTPVFAAALAAAAAAGNWFDE